MMKRFLLSCAFVFFAQTANAQMSPQQVRDICMPDIRLLCAPELATRDRTKIRACLLAKRLQTSPNCQAAIRAAQIPPKNN